MTVSGSRMASGSRGRKEMEGSGVRVQVVGYLLAPSSRLRQGLLPRARPPMCGLPSPKQRSPCPASGPRSLPLGGARFSGQPPRGKPASRSGCGVVVREGWTCDGRRVGLHRRRAAYSHFLSCRIGCGVGSAESCPELLGNALCTVLPFVSRFLANHCHTNS